MNKNFDCIVIKKGSISDISWLDENYAEKISNLNLYEIINNNCDEFMNIIEKYLEINKYDISKIKLNTTIVGDEPYYLYEIIYIDFLNNEEYCIPENENQIANLYNIENFKIYSNAIIFKTHIPSLYDSLDFCSITKNDLKNILYDRVYTKIVIWDGDKWKETRVACNLDNYAKIFFDDDDYEKYDLIFLNHNLYFLYTTSYGERDICGKLINKPIDKCIIFTMKSEEYRGNITLDEVNKIIYLSKILDTYSTPPEFLEDTIDSSGRKIIYNKYKVLDNIYYKYK